MQWMSAAATAEDDADQTSHRTGWSTKLHHVGWRLYHHATKHVGVGIVCSVAYFDPGNWGVDLQAGSQYGYSLLFTVLLAGIFATFLQVLATRLGAVTGLDLGVHCRLLFHDRPRHKLLWRWVVFWPLYILAEIAIICTDLAEMLGSAIALILLFPSLPLWSAVLLTATDVILLLAIENPLKSRPVRLFEGVISALVLAVLICMAVIISKVQINWGDAFLGFVPSKGLFTSGSLYTSVGIIGATVMPHTLFLGSRLATQDRLAKDSETDLPKTADTSSSQQMTLSQRVFRWIRLTFSWRRLFHISQSDDSDPGCPPGVLTHADWKNNELRFVKSHMYHGMADVSTSLMSFAVIINSMILVISGAVFYYNSGAHGSQSPASLIDAHALIKDQLGNGAALLFALALLASGQSASIIGTVAAQCVSEGFLRWKISPTLRRLITRILGIVPSVIVASITGEKGVNTLLVASQVVLSIVLPFAIFPLVYLTSSKRIMSVKSPSEPKFATQDTPGVPSIPVGDVSENKAVESNDKTVDFSNGKIVTILGYLMCLVIFAANIYVLVTL